METSRRGGRKTAGLDLFSYHVPTRVLGGQGCVDRLADEVSGLPRTCLVVAGRRSARLSGLLDRVSQLLQGAKIETTLFDQVEPNPTIETIQDGAELARSSRSRWVLGVGGGSSLDAAKAIALMTVNQGDTRHFFGQLRPENPPLPVVAIPTTSGTGSEVTQYAVVTDVQAGDKFGIGLVDLFPRLAFLDPSLTLSMPENVTLNTGLDALSHAIEAVFSLRRSAWTDVMVGYAIRRVRDNLPLVKEQPGNIAAREEMQLAAAMAGMAIANTGTLAPHAMGYPVTVGCGVAHGRVTALLLPAFLERMKELEPERTSYIGNLLGGEDAAETLRAFIESLGVAPSLGAYGMQEKDIEKYSRLAHGKKHFKSCPGEWSREDIEKMYIKCI